MPLAHKMTPISRLSEVVRKYPVLSVQTVGMEPAHSRPLETQAVRVVASQEGGPGGRTLGVEVGLVQPHPGPGQALQLRRLHLLIVPGDVSPPEIVSQHHD